MQVDVRDAAHWQEIKAQVAQHGGVAARNTGGPPQPFATVEVVFGAASGELTRCRGQIVQISPDGQVYVVFDPAAKDTLASVEWVADLSGEPAASGVDDDPRPLWMRYAELGKADKIKLARQGNQEARRLIVKDTDQALHLHLLGNPGLSAAEVATLVRSGAVGGGFIQRIVSQRSDMMSNASVVEAIVSSPQTPVPLAIQLLPRLPVDVLRRIAKTGSLRMPIVQAARKRVLTP